MHQYRSSLPVMRRLVRAFVTLKGHSSHRAFNYARLGYIFVAYRGESCWENRTMSRRLIGSCSANRINTY